MLYPRKGETEAQVTLTKIGEMEGGMTRINEDNTWICFVNIKINTSPGMCD